MKELKKLAKLERNEYYEMHLSIVNCLLPVKLTETELKVLSRFMALEGDVIEGGRFSTKARKAVRKSLELTVQALSNHMRNLKDKDFIFYKGESLEIWDLLVPESDEQTYLIKIVNIG